MSKIPDNIIESIKNRLDIVDVISQYISIKKDGRGFKALCPFHNEKTPSFKISPDKQIFHCFGCGEGGNVFNFVMKIEKLNFYETLKLLAEKTGIKLPAAQKKNETSENDKYYEINRLSLQFFKSALKKSKKAYNYFRERQLTEETITLFELGYSPNSWDSLKKDLFRNQKNIKDCVETGVLIQKNKNVYDRFRDRVIFPIFDIRSRPIGFGGRVLTESKRAKYINSPESPIYIKGENLYGLNLSRQYIAMKEEVILVEGYMDLIMCYQNDIKNIVASLGTALTPVQIRLLKRYCKNILILYDSDAAGLAAMQRNIEVMLEMDVFPKVVLLEENKDPSDYIIEYGKEKFEERIKAAIPFLEFRFRQLLKNINISSAAGKQKLIKLMGETLGKVNNLIIKDEYIKKISEKLRIKEEIIEAELKKIRTNKFSGIKEDNNIKTVKEKPSIDKKILQFLLKEDNKEYVKTIKMAVPLKDYREPYRIIMKAIYEFEESKTEDLLKQFNDKSEYRKVITAASLSSPDYMKGTEIKILKDCINIIKNRERKAKIRDTAFKLKKSIKEDELNEDLQQLLLEQAQLKREEGY